MDNGLILLFISRIIWAFMCMPVYMLYIHTSARTIIWENKQHSSDLTKQTRTCLTEKNSPNTSQKFWLCISLINLLYRLVLYYSLTDPQGTKYLLSPLLWVNLWILQRLDCSFHCYPPPIHILFSPKRKAHTSISAHVILKAVGTV